MLFAGGDKGKIAEGSRQQDIEPSRSIVKRAATAKEKGFLGGATREAGEKQEGGLPLRSHFSGGGKGLKKGEDLKREEGPTLGEFFRKALFPGQDTTKPGGACPAKVETKDSPKSCGEKKPSDPR